ncbi:hypothetical protein PENTCL1PPCAC_9656, partial [Pristionchus entomophagus]
AHPELVQTTLPYILPYLQLHTNQAYLVSRLASLLLGSCMADFSWASGGLQPVGAETTNGTAEKAASLFSSPPTTR